MTTDVLLVDLPRILALNDRLVTIQMIQTVAILFQYVED